MGKWIFGGLFAGVAAVFIIAGAVLVVKQDRAIRNAQPVKVDILSSQVTTTSRRTDSGRRTVYRPASRYSYIVSGQRYEGDRVYPGSMTDSGRRSAHEIVQRFPAGTRADGFYDRRDPSTAFLVRHYSFAPYLFVLFPMIHLAIGAGVMASGVIRLNRAPVMRPGGRWELPTGTPIGTRFRAAAALAGGWLAVGGLVAGHYLQSAERPYEGLAIVSLSIYFALGLIPLCFAGYYFLLRSRVSDAVVLVDAHPARRGQPITARIGLELSGGGRIDSATLTLACRQTIRHRSGGKNRISTSDLWTDEQPFAPAQDVLGARRITGEVRFVPPADQPPTTPKGTSGYPRHKWEMRVRVVRDGPDYRATIPVEVI